MRRRRISSWVLLQPERSNSYAQAAIQTLQADEHQRGGSGLHGGFGHPLRRMKAVSIVMTDPFTSRETQISIDTLSRTKENGTTNITVCTIVNLNR
jgi:hypothetical protein